MANRASKEDAERFREKAAELELERRALFDSFEEDIREAIIPGINHSLSTGYSISPEDSEVRRDRDFRSRNGLRLDDSTPTTFHLVLRVHYQEKPITRENGDPSKVYSAQNRIGKELDRIASDYGLSKIELEASPMTFD